MERIPVLESHQLSVSNYSIKSILKLNQTFPFYSIQAMRENGELHQMWEKWRHKKEDCSSYNSEPIQMESLVSAFVMFVACLVASILLLLLELIFRQLTTRRSRMQSSVPWMIKRT